MREEIEVGEYVRNESGYIHKVKDEPELMNFFIDKDGKLKEIAGVDFWNEDIYENIIRHSKNIIELIEKNDWVNGQHVKEVKNGYVMVGNGIDGFQVWEEDIRTIVTKELFKSVEYEVK